MFTLQIKTGGDAFDGDTFNEVARILRDVADRIEFSGSVFVDSDPHAVRDVNGNRVGSFTFTEEEN